MGLGGLVSMGVTDRKLHVCGTKPRKVLTEAKVCEEMGAGDGALVRG